MTFKMLFLMETIFYFIFAIPSSIIDVKKFRIPLIYVCLGIFTFIIFRIVEFYYLYSFSNFFKSRVINLLIAIVSSAALYFIVRLFSAEGLGIGDIIFGVYTALYCGFYLNLIAAAFAALSGILFYLFLSIFQSIRKKRLQKQDKVNYIHKRIFVIPFVPFITFGAFLSKILTLLIG